MSRGERNRRERLWAGRRLGRWHFLERGFDWIALVVITLLILLTLLFFTH